MYEVLCEVQACANDVYAEHKWMLHVRPRKAAANVLLFAAQRQNAHAGAQP